MKSLPPSNENGFKTNGTGMTGPNPNPKIDEPSHQKGREVKHPFEDPTLRRIERGLGKVDQTLHQIVAAMSNRNGGVFDKLSKALQAVETEIKQLLHEIKQDLKKDLSPQARNELKKEIQKDLKKFEDELHQINRELQHKDLHNKDKIHEKDLTKNDKIQPKDPSKKDDEGEKLHRTHKEKKEEIAIDLKETKERLDIVQGEISLLAGQLKTDQVLESQTIKAAGGLSALDTHREVSKTIALIQKMVSQMQVGQVGGKTFTNVELKSASEVPSFFANANMTISTGVDGKMTVHFTNLTEAQVTAAVSAIEQHPELLLTLLDRTNVGTLQIGEQMIKLPEVSAGREERGGDQDQGREGGGGAGGGGPGGGREDREGREERGR